MTRFSSLLATTGLALTSVGIHAQLVGPGSLKNLQVELWPAGAGMSLMFAPSQAAQEPVVPASAAPQTSSQPNLRTDSKPHTNVSLSSDSGPTPETLGPNEQIPPDLGLDYSTLPGEDQQRGYTVIYSAKGVKTIPEGPAVVLPVTNPPEPATMTYPTPPEPPIRFMPTPPDPSPHPQTPVGKESAAQAPPRSAAALQQR